VRPQCLIATIFLLINLFCATEISKQTITDHTFLPATFANYEHVRLSDLIEATKVRDKGKALGNLLVVAAEASNPFGKTDLISSLQILPGLHICEVL
jgi:hypothetical protein